MKIVTDHGDEVRIEPGYVTPLNWARLEVTVCGCVKKRSQSLDLNATELRALAAAFDQIAEQIERWEERHAD